MEELKELKEPKNSKPIGKKVLEQNYKTVSIIVDEDQQILINGNRYNLQAKDSKNKPIVHIVPEPVAYVLKDSGKNFILET